MTIFRIDERADSESILCTPCDRHTAELGPGGWVGCPRMGCNSIPDYYPVFFTSQNYQSKYIMDRSNY